MLDVGMFGEHTRATSAFWEGWKGYEHKSSNDIKRQRGFGGRRS